MSRLNCSDKVFVYRLRPSRGYLVAILLIAFVAAPIAAYLLTGDRRFDPGSVAAGRLVVAVAAALIGIIGIVATAKLWFRHLWHRRH
jgi:hypothetical protein